MKKYFIPNVCKVAMLLPLIFMFLFPVYSKAQVQYDLSVGGEKVCSANYNDLTVVKGVSGTVKYDPDTKTLTLQDATIDTPNKNPIESQIEGLTIKVVGVNKVTSSGFPSMLFHKPATIVGDGTLDVGGDGWVGIFVLSTTLTIDNCTLNVKGAQYGINGLGGKDDKLVIRNATVSAEGKKNGSVRDIAELTLIGCKISEPEGAEFDSMLHAIILNDKILKEKVVIAKDPTMVDIPNAEKVSRPKVYTLNGICVQGELENQPTGVYIVNGKKIVKK